MQQINLAAAGNAENNSNLINPRFQAEALRLLRGYDTGVLSNSFYSDTSPNGKVRMPNPDFMWQLTATNVLNITVGRGMATAYGYDIQSESIAHFTVAPPSAGTKYVFIYLEWNLSNPVEAIGKIDIHENGASPSWTPSRQDNLITNPVGIYQMPLYRLTVSNSGAVTATVNWPAFGVQTIAYPLRAAYAGVAETADYANNAGKVSEETAAITNGVLSLGGKDVFRKKQISAATWTLHNTNSVGSSLTLSEALSDGDYLMLDYNPQYLSDSGWVTKIVKIGKMRGSSEIGIVLTEAFGGITSQSGISISCDAFSVSGKNLTYTGGSLIFGLAYGGGTPSEGNTIGIRKICKLYL